MANTTGTGMRGRESICHI